MKKPEILYMKKILKRKVLNLTLFVTAIGASDTSSVVEPMGDLNSLYSRSASTAHYQHLTRLILHIPNSQPLELVRLDLNSPAPPVPSRAALAYSPTISE